MKKLISFALLTCMLLSVAFSMNVYAAPAVDTNDPNTSRFYNDNSNTGLDAYPGTATIDGVWDENDDWANALPLTLNSTTKALFTETSMSTAYDGDIYLLWDAEALYILEVQRSCTQAKQTYANLTSGNYYTPWNSSYKAWATLYNIMPNEAFVANESAAIAVFT